MGSQAPIEKTVRAADGYPVAMTLFPGASEAAPLLIVSNASGVPQGFYRRFALYAQQAGFNVVTFDYRGIGQSAPATLVNFPATMLDWGQLDFRAVLESVATPRRPALVVAHSFGGYALGLADRPQLLAAAYLFGVGAGWHGYMPRMEGLKVWTMWNLGFPLLTRWKGYAPWKLLGIGEDIPLGVHRQWRRWCSYRHFFFDDRQLQPQLGEVFARLRLPITALNATDDLWAMPAARDALLPGYANAMITSRNVDPQPFGGLGHMGYFRQKAQPLWTEALHWLRQQAAIATQ